ncbi:DUF3093 domain-containing protein [Corynebacterium sphenisci]|uniref:DUF3093 domain-containing protein n=1 Tax=Corynebacterium sphenisci TaxID=191493 RepID=UPI0026E068D1|nr:DUF3093 domain-containing protein [Corynebacterium sphenisci]MDO5731697.1 DUF3093 domain-containing protein [Corynebacterium sphenisci]
MSEKTTNAGAPAAAYAERLWVPWWYWPVAFAGAAVCTAQVGFNRPFSWTLVGGAILFSLTVWILLAMSRTRVRVEIDGAGERWLHAGEAMLPASVVSRSLAVPKSAQRNALGRQLDPAAFLVTHGWVPDMVLLVLDDPDDPTPYWLVSTRRPERLLDAFLGPDRAGADAG